MSEHKRRRQREDWVGAPWFHTSVVLELERQSCSDAAFSVNHRRYRYTAGETALVERLLRSNHGIDARSDSQAYSDRNKGVRATAALVVHIFAEHHRDRNHCARA